MSEKFGLLKIKKIVYGVETENQIDINAVSTLLLLPYFNDIHPNTDTKKIKLILIKYINSCSECGIILSSIAKINIKITSYTANLKSILHFALCILI
jgi:hypothetical protein